MTDELKPMYKVHDAFRDYDKVIINDVTGELIYGARLKRGNVYHLIWLRQPARVLSRKVPAKDLIRAAELADAFLSAERESRRLELNLQMGLVFLR